jgi:hypothetical protein
MLRNGWECESVPRNQQVRKGSFSVLSYGALTQGQLYAMSVRTLEARLEHLSVNDENEPVNNGSTMLKSKVKQEKNHSEARC